MEGIIFRTLISPFDLQLVPDAPKDITQGTKGPIQDAILEVIVIIMTSFFMIHVADNMVDLLLLILVVLYKGRIWF